MIKITKGPEPNILIQNSSQWMDELEKARTAGEDEDRFRRLYRAPEIIDGLLDEAHRKCVYCECKPLAGIYRIVEHIVPWSVNVKLAFAWLNLVLTCERCNGAKLSFWDQMQPLIDPTIDEPLDELFFGFVMMFGKTDKGSNTVREIKLNRIDLYEERRSWLRRIGTIVAGLSAEELVRTGPGSLLYDAFESPENEYSQASKTYIDRNRWEWLTAAVERESMLVSSPTI
jgi:5-methylcytosine-specific restriction endonuclease McrA